jgi:hypothetical protein
MDLISSKHCRRPKEWSNDYFERIWRHWMLVLWTALTKYNCTKCTTTTSTTLFLSLLQDKKKSYVFIDVPSYLEWIRNWSFIGQQPYQAKDHLWFIKASNDSILMCWQFTMSLSHLYIKEWRLRELKETQQQFTSAKTLSKLFCIKCSLRIS